MPHTVIVGAGIIGVSTAYFLSHAPSRGEDHTITILDPSPPASGASGKAGGLISRNWIGGATASLEDLSFHLHKDLAQQYGGAERWGYRRCQCLAVVGGDGMDQPNAAPWNERLKNVKKSPYSGDLNWIQPGVINSQILLGEPDSFAQVY
jgi:glycine/D-amino acid oxidase-like deaminating enzyme